MNWLERLVSWQRADPPVGPLRVTLYPTNRCNLRCSICWQREFEFETAEMPEERLLRLVDECADAGVRDWLIVGGGEPMVRGDTVTAVAHRIMERGMNGCLQTNGTMLRDSHMKALIEMKWPSVIISLDGSTEEINDRIRSKGSFSGAVKTIRRLAELKRNNAASRPRLSLNVTLTRLIADKLEDLFDLARDIGCDGEVNLCGLVVMGKETESLVLRDDDWMRLTTYANKLRECPWPYPFRSNLTEYVDSGELVDKAARMDFEEDDIAGARCYEPWLSLVVMPDGRVGPCCVMCAPDLDSLAEKTLKEVWRGPYMEGVRALMRCGGVPDYCKYCPSRLALQAREQRRILWEQDQWRRKGPLGRTVFLAGKALTSARHRGLRQLGRRGIEWLRIQRMAR